MDAWLNCEIGPGQFPGEVSARGVSSDGNRFSLFVDEERVRVPSPVKNTSMPGRIRVRVVASDASQRLVRLPAESFEMGLFVTVQAAQLQEERVPQEA